MSTYQLRKFDLTTIPDGAVIVALGRRGTGKTKIVENIMYEKRYLPDGIGCSGTEESNQNLGAYLPSSYIYTDYDRDAIERAVNRARYVNKIRQEQGLPKKFSFIIIDDCACDDAFTKDKTIKRILMNGRHYGLFFIFTMQYPLLVRPELRSQIDYVFMCREPILSNRKRLYESYAGVIPTFEEFNNIMMSVCKDYRALVVAQNVVSDRVEDCVFHFKADVNLPKFRVGSNNYWQLHFARFNPHHDESVSDDFNEPGEVTYEKSKKRTKRRSKYTTSVKLLD